MIEHNFTKRISIEISEMTGNEIIKNTIIFNELLNKVDECLDIANQLALFSGRNHKDAGILVEKFIDINNILCKDQREIEVYIKNPDEK